MKHLPNVNVILESLYTHARKCTFLGITDSINNTFSRVVIEADGITPIDGPDGPSLIGSVDNVFKAIKDYDQYRCIEKML